MFDSPLAEVPPAAEEPDVEPETLDCVLSVADELVPPEALPEPDDWLVCAPWFIVEDGLVVVALWLAVAPLDEFTPPEPTFTSGLILAPALTSVLLMPTLASTPTFGFTFVEELGCDVEDWLVEDDWSVVD